MTPAGAPARSPQLPGPARPRSRLLRGSSACRNATGSRQFALRWLPAPLIVAAVVARCASSSTGPASGAAASLTVSGLPTSVVAGATTGVTVTAKDGSGSTATGYRGTVRFSSTDAAARLPPNYPFVASDAGTHTFSVAFGNPGTESLTATDVASSSIVGSQTVTVVAGKVFYVVNLANSVLAQASTATGNVAPSATLAGSNTGLGPPQVNSPFGIARDTVGHLYVTVDGSNNSIVVFAAGATGNATPAVTIAGSNTALNYPRGIALDAGGRLYVANSNFSGQGCTPAACGSVTVYAASASGNAAPVDTIVGTNTGLDGPVGIALFSGQLYVANNVSNAITVYASTATGNVPPTATLAGGNTGLAGPQGIALDAAGRLYVTNASSNSVTVYAAGATGNASPVATITGSNTGLSGPLGIALDATGRVYVANESVNSITVYAAGATGNATPVAIIAGSSTGLNQPTFITF